MNVYSRKSVLPAVAPCGGEKTLTACTARSACLRLGKFKPDTACTGQGLFGQADYMRRLVATARAQKRCCLSAQGT